MHPEHEADPFVEEALRHVRTLAPPHAPPVPATARVALHLHPDHLRDGRTVLAHLTADGVYRTQFETGTSNGGLTAHPGGDRWRWEQRLFGGVYDHAPPEARPRYGAVGTAGDTSSLGPAPRFGSARLVLAPHVLARTTFCFPDSVFEPTLVGTADRYPVPDPACDATAPPHSEDPLDHYVEAHVHGPVSLSEDVEALALDPSHRGTPTHEQAVRLADRHGVALHWHEGRVLTAHGLAAHEDYRGAEVVEAGRRVAEDGRLDAAVLGRARARGTEDPQVLKKVWHLLARHGTSGRMRG
ncbi:DUF3626 domain-containing protein [Nocardioides bruguierae]|uniref:DUF3626 domain-containing protein n=1 Tax=Nocardioides bruguierae TaxID=2945102 RepID=UPI0020224708|nr:DUF3626 domain-containing protein [Nocardioides bruguierae]MCL8027570.1 DUF3626 domain-containing protein [Nocardioides bruguierae]